MFFFISLCCQDTHHILPWFTQTPSHWPLSHWFPTPVFANCDCQVHFPFLLFRLCFSHSALASLHLPASPRLCTCLELFRILPAAPRPHPTRTPSSDPVSSSGIFSHQIQALITSGQHSTSSSPTELPTHAHRHNSYSCCKATQHIHFLYEACSR